MLPTARHAPSPRAPAASLARGRPAPGLVPTTGRATMSTAPGRSYPCPMEATTEADRERLWPVGLLLIAPVVGLAALLVQPQLDLHWEHQPSHFWLVLVAAAVNVVLA